MRWRNPRVSSPEAREGEKAAETIAVAGNSIVARAAYVVAVRDRAGWEVLRHGTRVGRAVAPRTVRDPQSHLL